MRTIALALLLAAPLALADDPAGKIELSVLYAGVKEDPRTAEFKWFLSQTFTRVEAIGLAELSTATARDAEVVIVDSPSPYGNDGKFGMPQVPTLDATYRKPTILMGAAGGAVLTRDRTLKLGWL